MVLTYRLNVFCNTTLVFSYTCAIEETLYLAQGYVHMSMDSAVLGEDRTRGFLLLPVCDPFIF